VEQRPRARRLAEKVLRNEVRVRRIWFRNEREKQQLRDLLFAQAMRGREWSEREQTALAVFLSTLRCYSAP
jgi:hypothetical protein